MNEQRHARAALAAAGILSIGMGGFHFWLPQLFRWADGIASAPDSLRWALLALNAFWSGFAVATGALALGLALARRVARRRGATRRRRARRVLVRARGVSRCMAVPAAAAARMARRGVRRVCGDAGVVACMGGGYGT